MFSRPTPQSRGDVESIPELSTSNGEPFSHKRGEWSISEKCSWAFLFPPLALIPPWTQSNKNTRNDRPLPPPNSATGQNHFITLRPQGVGARQVQSYTQKMAAPWQDHRERYFIVHFGHQQKRK